MSSEIITVLTVIIKSTDSKLTLKRKDFSQLTKRKSRIMKGFLGYAYLFGNKSRFVPRKFKHIRKNVTASQRDIIHLKVYNMD